MKKLMLFLVLAAAAAFAAAPAYQFSADMVMTTQGHSASGKYFMNGDKMRMEMSMMGQSSITITRQDKKLAWILMPAQKSYMEISMAGRTQSPTPFDATADFKYTPMGTETVDGHPCKKMKFAAVHEGQTITGFHWLATDLKDIPIKWSDEKGTNVVELKNVKLGPSAADLFELPAGYKKMEMPTGHPQTNK